MPVSPEPSDDEAARAELEDFTLTLPHPLIAIQGSYNPRYTLQMGSHVSNIPAPKRPGGPLDTSSNKEQRASQDPDEITLDINLADFGLPSWGDKHLQPDANRGGRGHAVQFPILGWSNFVLFVLEITQGSI